mmetsp:Transcript_3365/g.15333  ORF Transcript_3365/g.15333 Transcript_3365/m.15333 type:complete len:335 (-) Transcript_3365:444-1448(-)
MFSFSRLIGLAMNPCIWHALHSSTTDSATSAVSATMCGLANPGLASTCPKISLVACSPSMTGICRSIRMRSNDSPASAFSTNKSSASFPLFTTAALKPTECSSFTATFWFIRLSSAINTRTCAFASGSSSNKVDCFWNSIRSALVSPTVDGDRRIPGLLLGFSAPLGSIHLSAMSVIQYVKLRVMRGLALTITRSLSTHADENVSTITDGAGAVMASLEMRRPFVLGVMVSGQVKRCCEDSYARVCCMTDTLSMLMNSLQLSKYFPLASSSTCLSFSPNSLAPPSTGAVSELNIALNSSRRCGDSTAPLGMNSRSIRMPTASPHPSFPLSKFLV